MVDDLCGIPQAMQDRAIFGCCGASTWACRPLALEAGRCRACKSF